MLNESKPDLMGNRAPWRQRLYTIIFEADTKAGRYFDLILIAAILISVAVVVADSVQAISQAHHAKLYAIEWCLTVLFTLEYVARLVCAPQPLRYATSFYGVIDLLAIVPTYLTFLAPELGALVDIRVLRLLRIFRILKLVRYVKEYQAIGQALRASSRKIMVFLATVMLIVLVVGTLMYVVEGPEHGYTSIPVAVYWAITTMTTVGYGDISPQTDFGRLIASVMMLLGWGTLAVPTGIVTTEMVLHKRRVTTRTCPGCMTEGHLPEADFCFHCATRLLPYESDSAKHP